MNKKNYYDTGVFWRFFNLHIVNIPLMGKINKYSPLANSDVIKITAPWTLDEFFHSYISEKRKEVQFPFFKSTQIKRKIESLSKIDEYLSLFKQELVDTREINLLFTKLFMMARDKNILSLMKNDNKIHSKDLLHLSYALCSHCHTFITCDNGFKLLKKVRPIEHIIQYYKLKKVIIISNDLSSILDTTDFSI